MVADLKRRIVKSKLKTARKNKSLASDAEAELAKYGECCVAEVQGTGKCCVFFE